MKYYKIVQLLAILFLTSLLQAQNCLPAGIVFETQADIDQFATNYPGCSVIDGDVCIGQCINIVPTDITNLDGLLQLTSIHGNLKISDNASLANLNGLQNLASVDGNLDLSNNSLLANLNMTTLRIIGGSLTIDHSGLPESLPALQRVGGNYTSITDSSKYVGNNTLKYIGGDVIIEFQLMDTIIGFEFLDTIEGELRISFNNNLSTINALHHIKYLSSYKMSYNQSLAFINDLDELTYLGKFTFVENGFNDLPDFKSLSVIDGDFFVYNEGLTEMHGFESIKRINGSFYLKGAEAIEDFQQEGFHQRMGDGIDGFNNLTFVGGDFTLPLHNFLSDINGFSKLDSIGHNFEMDFRNCDHTFPQHNHFKFIGGDISLEDLHNFKDLQCFQDLTEIFGSLKIWYCDSLVSLQGLEGISNIDGDLSLRLHSIDRLSPLIHLRSIGGGLEINSTRLVNLAGLDSVRSIHGSLFVSNNWNLESLEGIEGIDPTGFISSGFYIEELIIINNPLLSFCRTQNICDALRVYHKSHWFLNNDDGCNEPEQILCSEYSLTGIVFYDKNHNKMQDSTEHGIPGIKIHFAPDDKVVMTDEDGFYALLAEENTTHTITLDPDNVWFITTDSSQYTRIFQSGLLSNAHNDFGVVATSPFSRISVNLTSEQERCNRLVGYYLKGCNESSKTISGRLIVKYDSIVTYVDGDISPDSVNPFSHLLIWNFKDMSPFDFLKSKISFQMPDESHVGETMHFTAYFYVDSASVEVLKDSMQYNPVLKCSHDPNDKIVNPAGEREQNYTLKDDYLNYTIRFENTGNTDAIDITVIDTLDASLDMNTFKVVNSTVPPITYVKDHVVEFHMPNIWLAPDETALISYEIKPISDVPNLTSIENKASIIFESNQPIVTNTTKNTLVDELCTDVAKVENITICHGESYLGHSETGVYIDTARIGIYCDSIHQLNLTVRDLEIIDMDTLICEGESFHGYDSAGIYTYESINPLTGCTDVVQLTLGIIPLGESICTTGSINVESDDLKIYPNPTSDEIYIETKKSIESIILTTLDGKKIPYTWQPTNDKVTKLIPGENTPGGLYIVTIISGGHLYNHKIIIL